MFMESQRERKSFSYRIHPEIQKKLKDIERFKKNLISGRHRTVIDGSVYNNHTICIKTFCCSVGQIYESVKKAVDSFSEVHPDLLTDFTLNVVMQTDGSYAGRTFVHFRDPRIYNALIGHTLEGKKHVKQTDDPEWVPSTKRERTGSWADEEEDEPPKITVEADRLLTLPPVTNLTEEQKTSGKNLIYLQLNPAHITPGVGEGFSPKVLRIKPVTSIFGDKTYDKIMEIFSKYADTQLASKKYPIVRVFPKSDSALVIFGSHEDAQFARLMSAKLYIKGPDDKISVIKCYPAKEMNDNTKTAGYTG